MARGSLQCLAGDRPLILVAPHGGRRDAAADPWHRGGLRTNDLHTADLTLALARATGAAAIVNATHDRNRIDLNRVDEIADRLPGFLDALHEALDRAVRRHGRATLLTVHGWNTMTPSLDLGLGCRPGRELDGERPGPAVSPGFARRALPALAAACGRRGVAVSVGRRYPARARQNLIQLFTGRWRDDTREVVARVARFTPHCDAVQLEIGIPLRWPGRWRDGFVAAICEAAPALLDPTGQPEARLPQTPAAPPAAPRRLEFVSEPACGLAALDGRGGRLLLVGLHAGLDLVTYERVAAIDGARGGPIALEADPPRLAYRGPIGRFRDTTAFLDLEAALAAATVAPADVALAFRPAHRSGLDCPFGHVEGHVRIAGRTHRVRGPALLSSDDAPPPAAWMDLGDGRRLALSASAEEAICCDGTTHRRVDCRLTTGEDGTVLVLGGPAPCRVPLEAEHRIPIVRGRSRPATSAALTTYRIGARRAGWGQRVGPEAPVAEPRSVSRRARPDA